MTDRTKTPPPAGTPAHSDLTGLQGGTTAQYYHLTSAEYSALGGSGAPTAADYLVKTANAGLSAERVVTDTASVVWDWATGGQAKADVQFGTTATTACVGNDSRLSDSRTPASHATSHKSGGGDAVKLDELAAPTDVTTLNASTTAHGLCPKGTGDTTTFLRDDLTWATPPSGVSYTLVATLASDQATGANTTPVDLSGLVFSYASNSKYRIWFMGKVAPAAATTGCGFQFNVSSAVTAIDVLFYHQLANTGTLSGGHSIADDASVGVSSGMPGTSTYSVAGQGLIITTTNTGTAQLRFRSETTAVTTCKAGFTLVVEKIA